MGNSRIDETISGFNTYIITTDDFLQAISSGIIHNWERLGLTNANATGWQDKRVFWQDTLYPKYQNPLLSTSTVKTQVRDFMDGFRTFANPLLNIMAASPNATSDDEAVFNFKIGREEPSHSTTSITDAVIFEPKLLSGGDIKFICRTSHDDHRASKADRSDSIQMAYLIQNPEPAAQPPGSGTTEEEELDPDDLTQQTFTKAIFVKHFGGKMVGKKVVVFFRWYNTKHPELAGPWSSVTALVIP